MPDTQSYSNCSSGASQQFTETVALNSKLQYDEAAQLQHQSFADNQEDSRAWSQLKLRIAQNAATVDHFTNMTAAQTVAVASQTGDTANQQTVSPVRTGTGDAIVGTVGVSADAVSASIANLATSLVPVIATAVATATAQTITAILPSVLAAAGAAAGTSTADTTKS